MSSSPRPSDRDEQAAAKGLPEHSPPERFGPFPPMRESDDVTPVPATDADASAASTEPDVVIDADEFEAAKDDPEWREFCEQADAYVKEEDV